MQRSRVPAGIKQRPAGGSHLQQPHGPATLCYASSRKQAVGVQGAWPICAVTAVIVLIYAVFIVPSFLRTTIIDEVSIPKMATSPNGPLSTALNVYARDTGHYP